MNDDPRDHDAMRARPSGSTFAGREAELQQLEEAFANLESSGARTVLIAGEAGIGKTRLTEELLARARAAGALTGIGACSPVEGGLPYGPIVGVLRDLARQLDPALVATVVEPPRAALGFARDGMAGHGDVNKTQRFEAVLECFGLLGEQRRTVLVLEDLHWADSASIELLDFLTRNLGASPVLLVGTFRNDEIDHRGVLTTTIAELARRRGVLQIELAGLDRDATAVLVGELLGEPPEWTLLTAVHARGGGNPFFTEELTAARATPSLPAALRNVALMRIERLDPAARAIAALVAAAGSPIDHRLVEAASDADDGRLDTALAEAVAAHVLVVDDGGRLRFRHELQREVLYESLLPTERTRLHRRLADALRERADLRADDPVQSDVELARHAWEASAWPEAMHAALRAAHAMVALLAIPEADAQYERALAAFDRCSPAERAGVDQVDLLVNSADVAYLVGDTARAVELAELALAHIEPGAHAERAAVALTMYGRHAFVTGDVAGAYEAFARAIALLPDHPTAELARVLAQEASSLMVEGRREAATARSREAIEVARATGARSAEGHGLCTLGVCLVEAGDIDTGIAVAREAVVIAEELGLPMQLERAYTNMSHVLMVSGRLDEGVRLVQTASGEWTTGLRLNAAGLNSVEILIRLGRYDDAAELLGRMSERGTGACVFGPHALQALLALRRGQLDDAAAHLDSADRYFGDTPAPQGRGIGHTRRAELLLEQERPDDAYDQIEQALADVATTDDGLARPEMCAIGLRALVEQRDAARGRGRTVDVDKMRGLAAALVEQAERDLGAFAGRGDGPPPALSALVAQCHAEATRLDAPAPERWRVAVDRWTAAGEPWPAAYCRWREAEAALATPGARADAVAAATAAWRAARSIGAQALAARVEQLAQRARLQLADDVRDEDDAFRTEVAENLALTKREVDVLDQLARGRTDREIADALFISKKTVSVHVSNILRKLPAGNRVDAGEIGQRAGLGR